MLTFVFLCAGKGKRLWPITENTQKTMVRVLGKPIVEWGVENAAPHCDKIVLVVGENDFASMKKLFSSKSYFGKLEFVLQGELKGSGHAPLVAKEAIGESDFVVCHADGFYDQDFCGRMALQAAKGTPFVVGKRVADARPYGLLSGENGFLKGVKEKPKELVEGVVFTGCYFMKKDFFAFLEKLAPSPRGELEVTDAFAEYSSKNKALLLEENGYWNDVGYYWNFLDASFHAASTMMENNLLGEVSDKATFSGKVFVGKGSKILSGCVIQGPVYIGENCLVGPNAFLRPGTVLEGSNHVGNGVEIKNSVLFSGAKVPHLSYIGDSVVCENVNLGAGTKVANLRFDGQAVHVHVNGSVVNSLQKKLGCVIGAGTQVGINASINCGVLIGSNCKIFPGVVVKKNVESNTVFEGEK